MKFPALRVLLIPGADLGGLTYCHTSPPFLEGFQQLLEHAEAMEYLLTLDVQLIFDL